MNIKDIKNSQFKDKNILITGCSKGIGRSLVIKLSQLGANVILLSRNEKKMDELYDFIFVNPSKRIGKFLWKQIDGSVIDRFGPDGISKVIKNFSARAVKFQSGYIYQYAFIMLLGFSVLLTLLILV